MSIKVAGVVVKAARASPLLSPFVIANLRFFKKSFESFKSAAVMQNSIPFLANIAGL